MGDYVLRCLAGGELLEDHYTLACPNHPGFVRAEYKASQLTVRENLPGIFRFSDWLPVHSFVPNKSRPVTFQNRKLCRELGLPNLWITFTGYYPERGCYVPTGSFKELEALPTIVRLNEAGGGTLVVASAGNTGRAFAQMSAEFGTPVVLVVPESSADKLWTAGCFDHSNIRLITVRGDYTDAIKTADKICEAPGFFPEGGGKNIARRDGMGCVMLDAAVTIGKLPEYYFQAVGSGTGGIAAWEAAVRLIGDGRFGSAYPELHLSQNLPFVPMVRAWNAGRDHITEEDMPNAQASIAAVSAHVLTNRTPPYGIRGGVYDAMKACGGRMYTVENSDAASAAKIFAEAENGIDIDPAAAVAFASLISAAEEGSIRKNATILLNITGGGYERVKKDCEIAQIGVYTTVDPGEVPAL
ncbi:MAG: cysteate synthase [Methanocorpusculum sp.]|uniref:cysteate synthase n=1 Tax=Methanocorpusculum sp. TaxID=2058474 RepID=UPI002725BEF9|nr:cysteate synthase [Methanocorpusculum sp.]MDO9523600.1 cysteate synthase [Methanocorpusculum sp.]